MARALRQRGEREQADPIDALVEAARDEVVPSLDLLTSSEAGDLIGIAGQTIKNWILQGRPFGYRIGRRMMVPRGTVEEYLRRARESVELEAMSDPVAAEVVAGPESEQALSDLQCSVADHLTIVVAIARGIRLCDAALLAWPDKPCGSSAACGVVHCAQEDEMARRTADRQTRAISDRILSAVREVEPTAQVILYGSRARGEAAPDSDWDILVLVDGPADPRREEAITHRLLDVQLETDSVFSVIVHSKEDWASRLFQAMPFHENVTREGIAL